MTTLIYLHGFLSSPQSHKAQLLCGHVAAAHPMLRTAVPLLPDRPAAALAAAEAAVTAALAAGAVGLVGSSMGGFYATVLAARFGLPCVVINPAVEPHRHLWRFFGAPVHNPYTAAVTQLDQDDADAMERMLAAAQATGRCPDPAQTWLLVQTGDEVIDYRLAVAWYRGCRQTVEAGGDHQFQDFERHLPAVVKFLQCGADPSSSA